MYQLSLEAAGFEVIAAYTGGDGVTLARARQPDVIVLDLRLPGISGWEACHPMKTDPIIEAIPVVILTAATSPALPELAAHAGCAADLPKPLLSGSADRDYSYCIAGPSGSLTWSLCYPPGHDRGPPQDDDTKAGEACRAVGGLPGRVIQPRTRVQQPNPPTGTTPVGGFFIYAY